MGTGIVPSDDNKALVRPALRGANSPTLLTFTYAQTKKTPGIEGRKAKVCKTFMTRYK